MDGSITTLNSIDCITAIRASDVCQSEHVYAWLRDVDGLTGESYTDALASFDATFPGRLHYSADVRVWLGLDIPPAYDF